MDGTAIMQGVATGFIAQAYGIELGASDYLMVVLTATLASIGTAGVLLFFIAVRRAVRVDNIDTKIFWGDQRVRWLRIIAHA